MREDNAAVLQKAVSGQDPLFFPGPGPHGVELAIQEEVEDVPVDSRVALC